MDSSVTEIKQRMDSGNPISIAIATDNLVNIIKSKIKGCRTDMTNIPEMLLLQEYCCHQNSIICTTSFQALCAFMKTNNYQTQLLIDWFIVLSSQTKCKTGFIQEVFELIIFWLKSDEHKSNEYINTLVDLLIKVMDGNVDEWRLILFHIRIDTHFDNHEFVKKWLNSTKRLFKFIFLSPTPSNYRNSFIKLFVEILCCASDYELLFEIYSWLQIDNLDNILFAYNFLEEFWHAIPDTLHDIKYNLCLCITQTSVQLISYGYEPTYILQWLNSILMVCPCSTEMILLSISKTLNSCSSKFVLKIINFCLIVIQRHGCHKIIAQSVVASILQWNRTKIIDDISVNLFLSTVNSSLVRSRSCTNAHEICSLLTTDSFILISYSLTKLCPKFNEKQFISKWLFEISPAHEILNDVQFSFYLAGIYLCKIGDRSQQLTMLQLLNKKILLPLISYATNLETSHYNLFDLITSIPTAASVPENMSLIISLIKRFENSNEEALSILSIDMYFDLCMTELRCYRFLLYCLSKDKPDWKWNIVKLYTIKKMVKSNPSSDLVAILVQGLGFYIKMSMYLQIKLTLESLVDLCFTEYMSSEALQKLIEINANIIHHPSVISSYCNLLTVFVNQTTDNIKRHECFCKLWSMVLHSNDDIVKCALKSLSNINVEIMPRNVLPKKFQCFSKIATELEELEKMDLLNGPIPGECWITFLQSINQSCVNEAQLMLSAWLRQELDKCIVSRVPSDHEPKNLKHLPDHSIARGLLSFVVPKRKQTLSTDDDIKSACLSIINNANKTMYPFDWCFLEKYLIEGLQNKLWKESVVLIAKQSTTSTSAFRLLHKCYESCSNFDNNQVKLLFTVLRKVSNIIYHNLQKQFVIEVVNGIMNNIIKKSYFDIDIDTNFLCYILSECKQILKSSETHIENINFICNILANIWCSINIDNKKILHAFLDCCLAMPMEMFNNLKPYPVQESMLPKFVILCCAQNVLNSNVSFDPLNVCIKACNEFAKESDVLPNIFIEVFKLDIFVSYYHKYISNFMIYLASFTKKTNYLINNFFSVHCSIFINLIVTLSGYNMISSVQEKNFNFLVFPLALATFSKNSSQSSRTIEWLKTMRTVQNLPDKYYNLFYCCLVAFKNDKCLLQWTNRKQILFH